jgi:hypothetical protein
MEDGISPRLLQAVKVRSAPRISNCVVFDMSLSELGDAGWECARMPNPEFGVDVTRV